MVDIGVQREEHRLHAQLARRVCPLQRRAAADAIGRGAEDEHNYDDTDAALHAEVGQPLGENERHLQLRPVVAKLAENDAEGGFVAHARKRARPAGPQPRLVTRLLDRSSSTLTTITQPNTFLFRSAEEA